MSASIQPRRERSPVVITSRSSGSSRKGGRARAARWRRLAAWRSRCAPSGWYQVRRSRRRVDRGAGRPGRAWEEVRVGCDQLGRVPGAGEPGGVSAGHLIEPGAVNLVDRGPCALDGEVRVVGSEDEDRGCGDRGELRAGENALGARAAEPVDRVHERRHGSGVLPAGVRTGVAPRSASPARPLHRLSLAPGRAGRDRHGAGWVSARRRRPVRGRSAATAACARVRPGARRRALRSRPPGQIRPGPEAACHRANMPPREWPITGTWSSPSASRMSSISRRACSRTCPRRKAIGSDKP